MEDNLTEGHWPVIAGLEARAVIWPRWISCTMAEVVWCQIRKHTSTAVWLRLPLIAALEKDAKMLGEKEPRPFGR